MESPTLKPHDPEHYELVPKRELSREVTVRIGKNKFVIKNLNADQLEGVVALATAITMWVPDQPSILIKVTKQKWVTKPLVIKHDNK